MQVVGLVLLVAAVVFFFPCANNNKASDTGIQQPVAPPAALTTATNDDGVSQVTYRPFCLTYSSKATARILQTSMGNPSQQWSHLPCYAQPERVRNWVSRTPPSANINGYGAPDAILQTNLSKSPFANRTPIMGFGAAFTEAASLNYQTLNENGKQKLIDLFFGKEGLGYSLGRVHINSCDFSTKPYAFDTVDDDFDLKYFDTNVTHDSQPDGMIDMILRATQAFEENWKSADGVDGSLKVCAAPWSPPAWMKKPTSMDKEDAVHAASMSFSAQPTCLREGTGKKSRYAKAWALYFSKFIEACM